MTGIRMPRRTKAQATDGCTGPAWESGNEKGRRHNFGERVGKVAAPSLLNQKRFCRGSKTTKSGNDALESVRGMEH